MLAKSPVTRINGILVADLVAGQGSAERLEKVKQTLLLISKVDPRRYRRIAADLERIVITKARSAAEYVPAASACFIDAPYVETRSLEVLATAIVHESTHARLGKVRAANRRETRFRVERRCVLEEIAFLQRVGGTQPLIAELTRRLNEPWWTDHLVFQKRVEQLRGLGVPRWLLRIYESLFAPG